MNGCMILGAAKRSSGETRSFTEILTVRKGCMSAQIWTKFNQNAAFEMIDADIARLKSIVGNAARAAGLYSTACST
jgi:hypothetical protein